MAPGGARRSGPRQPDAALAARLAHQRRLPLRLAGLSCAGITLIGAAAYASPHRIAGSGTVAPLVLLDSAGPRTPGSAVRFAALGAPAGATVTLRCGTTAHPVLAVSLTVTAGTAETVLPGTGWPAGPSACRAHLALPGLHPAVPAGTGSPGAVTFTVHPTGG